MSIHPLAGKPAPQDMLVDLARLERDYYERRPDLDDANQRVAFGTSGHRGSSLRGSFNEAHILAITQAICDYRARAGHRRPALSRQGHARALGPGAAHRARSARRERRARCGSSSATASRRRPSISRAILAYNRGRDDHLADGIVITPSHNPPEDGGFKYNPPNGGPADTDVTRWIAGSRQRAAARRQRGREARPASRRRCARHDARRRTSSRPYVDDLRNVIDMDAIRAAGLTLGVDPLGGAAVHYWDADQRASTASTSTVVNPDVDPTFSFMTRRPRRQDPHGLLEPVRDGEPGRR